MKIPMLFSLLVIGLLLIAGCASQKQAEQSSAGELTQEAGNVGGVEQADKDLNTSELDNLDKELGDLSW